MCNVHCYHVSFLMILIGGKRHNKESSFGHVDQHKKDISHQINNVYVNKMQQLRVASNLMQVYLFKTSSSYTCLPLRLKQDRFF